MGFEFIVIAPFYHLVAASSLSLDTGYLFLMGSSVLLSMVVQQLVAILVLLQEEITASFLKKKNILSADSFKKNNFIEI